MANVRRGFRQRVWRWTLSLLLLPVCLGTTWAVLDLASASGQAFQFWAPFLAGATCWLVLYLSLPKPLWLYVVGHELTHALWSWMFGGRVKSFRATSKGGHVVVTKSNTLIVLAPYFFPLYGVLWTLFFWIGDACFGWRGAMFWFHFGLGTTYAFHVTLNAFVLRTRQPDLEGEGWIFSAVVIWLGNALVLLFALPLFTRHSSLLAAVGSALRRTGQVVTGLAHLF